MKKILTLLLTLAFVAPVCAQYESPYDRDGRLKENYGQDMQRLREQMDRQRERDNQQQYQWTQEQLQRQQLQEQQRRNYYNEQNRNRY